MLRFLLTLFAAAASADDVYVRLVDAKERAPLEFWEKDLSLPERGSTIRYRIPQKVYVDGEALPYGKYGQMASEVDTAEAKETNAGLDTGEDIETGSGAPKDKEADSDQKTKILGGMGVKALVKADVKPGTHTVHPGGLQFKLGGTGAIEASDPSLVKANEESLLLLCQPVDFNFIAGLAESVPFRVLSGGKPVFEDGFRLDRSQALRLYLPLSAEGYEAALGLVGRFSFQLDKEGVKLKSVNLTGRAKLQAEGITIVVHFEPAPPASQGPVLAAQESELYLFNDRNREVYAEGERVGVSVRCWRVADKIRLFLSQEKAKLALGDVPLSPAGAGAFAEFEVDTAILRPGNYTLQAEADGVASNPLPFRLAPVMPPTDMKVFSHVKWGGTSMDPGAIDKLADLGFNFLSNGVDDYHCFNGVQPGNRLFESWNGVPTDRDRFREHQKAHFPPELLERTLPIARGMQAMLARQVQFLAVHFPLILYFNVGDHWRDHAEDRYQAAQHLGMHIRHFPHFVGFAQATGDGPTPATSGAVWASAGVASFDVIHDQRLKKLKEVFEEKYGQIGVDTSDQEKLYTATEKDKEDQTKHGMAWGFRVGEEIKMKISGPEDKALLWGQWVNDIYPDNFRSLRRLLWPMVDEPMVTSGSTWGFGAGGGMHPGTFYRALDFPINDMHGDFGLCNFNYITGTDILNMGMEERTQRPWIGCDMPDFRVTPNGYKLLLQGMSRNPGGMGVLNVNQGDWVCGWARSKRTSEDLASWAEVPKRLGNVFMGLERQDEIAVLSSFRQEVLAGQSFRALWAAHYITQKAGYQATIITDAYCEAHSEELPKRYKAVFLFGMTKPLAPALADALSRFQGKGGFLIADGSSKPSVSPADSSRLIALPFTVPDSHGPSNSNDHLEFEDFFLPLVRQFREAVGPKLKPFFVFESQRKPPMHEINFTGIRSRDGDLEYLTVFNDGKPRQNADGSKADGTYAQFLYEGDRATVSVAKAGTLYDALRRSEVPVKTADGGMEFDVDALIYPGSIYLLAGRPVAALEVAHAAQVAPAALVRLRVAALDAAGKPFTGHLPVELTLTDPDGTARYQVFRRTNEDLEFKVAANDPAGDWRWTVWEQVTGLRAEGAFAVAPATGAPIPAGKAVKLLEETVCDAGAVYDFLKREVEIVLFPEELALSETAQQLEAELKKRGVRASVRILWPSDTRMYPMQWFYRTLEDREVREGVLTGRLLGERTDGKNHQGTYRNDSMGNYAFYKQYAGSCPYVYYHDVILLGRDDMAANPLLSHIRRTRMVRRNISPSFPAAGQGLVAYAWGPFHSPHDAVVVYGNGEAGLRKAMDSLVRLAEAKERPQRAYAPRPARLAEENGQVFRSMGLSAAAEPLKAVRSTEREAVSLLPPVYPRRIESAVADSEDRIFIGTSGEEATLATVELATKRAQRHVVPKELRPGSATELAWLTSEGQGKLWLPRNMARLGDEFIAPAERGIGRFDRDGLPVWFHDPFPAFNSYEEIRFPRRVRNFAVSADKSRVLAAFWNVAPDQGGPSFFNRADLVLLDAKTGKPVCTMESYFGHHLALSADGSRAVVLDLEHPYPGEHNKRKVHNPHEWTGMSLFDQTGKELMYVRLDRSAERLLIDDRAALALITFNDARRILTLVDLSKRTHKDIHYPRIDVGAAVAPDGSFAVVCYIDGTVRKLAPDGSLLLETKLPVYGLPAVSRKNGSICIVSPDGAVSVLSPEGKVEQRIEFAGAQPTALEPTLERPPGPLERPTPKPYWETPPKGMKVDELKGSPFAEPATVAGEFRVTVPVPALKRHEILLLAFNYRLKDRNDRLAVTFARGTKPLAFHFPYHLQPWPAAVPIKLAKAQPLEVTFAAKSGATVEDGRLLRVGHDEWSNVAWVLKPGSPESATRKPLANSNAPTLMVPNIYGQIGDPRCEQMAYGLKESDVYACFDRDTYAGTTLYKVVTPLVESWTGEWEPNLRGAEIVMEYGKPRVLSALGIWEQPGDLPNEAYTLECCDQYEVDPMTKAFKTDWHLVATIRNNTDYYHAHAFKPTKAKIWRLTLIRTPAQMQRLAEVELYEEEAQTMLDEGPEAGEAAEEGI